MRIKFYYLVGIILLLVIVRISLPYFALNYVTTEINKVPEYKVKIVDLELHLIQGKAVISNMELWKKNSNIPVPFFKANVINFSIQWAALLNGRLVAKIAVDQPIVNFVTASQKQGQQLSMSAQGIEIIKSLLPLKINQVTVNNGKAYLKNFEKDSSYSIYLHNIQMKLENVQNVKKIKNGLAAHFFLSADAMENATLKMEGKFDRFKKNPTFDMEASLKDLELPALNSFLNHYTKVRAEKGVFSLFVEVAAGNGKIKGYAKPFIKNFKVANENTILPHKIYQGAISLAATLLENPKKKTIATQINICGKVDDPNTETFSVIINLLRHAFIKALVPTINNKVSIKDVVYNTSSTVCD